MAAPTPRKLIAVGVFGAAHGVRGEVRLKAYTADPAGIAQLGPLHDAGGRARWTLTGHRRVKDDLLVVRVAGVGDRNAAEALTGTELFVPREHLPVPDDEDEFYHADLIGLDAETQAGTPLGRLVAVQNFGAGDLLEIACPGVRDTLLVPFTKAAVPVIDMARGRMVVVLPAQVEAMDVDTPVPDAQDAGGT